MRKIMCFMLCLSLMFGVVDIANASSTTSSKAIVIIPGIMGSSLRTTSGTTVWVSTNYTMLGLTENGTSIYSLESFDSDHYGAFDIYSTLYTSLYSTYHPEYDIIFFDYDFRLNNASAATKLATELSGYNEVFLIAHSMGGLVASKYLANSAANRAKTKAFISIGTPFVGSAKCINVMDNGTLLEFLPENANPFAYKTFVKNLCSCSYAAYQLLPTNKYYTTTGIYPIKVGGTNYSNPMAQLPNANWGKKADGSVKPMFSTAIAFHNTLYNSGVHVKNFTDVDCYTLAGNGENTIKKVIMNSNYEITDLNYSNAGDGTVLLKSAGLGTPDYSYSTTHIALVRNGSVLSRIHNIINSYASKANSSDLTGFNDEYGDELSSENLTINEKGWIMGLDNRRINIIADSDAILYCDGNILTEEGEYVYDISGNRKGNVWSLGKTDRKYYAMNDGEYQIVATGVVRIGYMNNGYYDTIEEYSSVLDKKIVIYSYSTMNTKCISDSTITSRQFSAEEVNSLNQ